MDVGLKSDALENSWTVIKRQSRRHFPVGRAQRHKFRPTKGWCRVAVVRVAVWLDQASASCCLHGK